jgi:hypothetical protein
MFMEKIFQYLPFPLPQIVFILLAISAYKFFPVVANSNFVIALVTSVVGSVAIYIYVKQRSDEITNAARIVFLELKESEKELKKLIDHKVRTDGSDFPQENIIRLLQNRAWSKYSHLFIKNFNNDEYQQLDEYFRKCDIIEKYFEKQHNFFWIATEERARQKESIGAKLAYDNHTMAASEFKTKVETIGNLYISNTANYAPKGITNEINRQLDSITVQSVTPLWAKLKELAGYVN